ncbi:TRAP transporter TatT component family protein [bacterium]|nr:TRAP transporter TatT component family protein [bacterium]
MNNKIIRLSILGFTFAVLLNLFTGCSFRERMVIWAAKPVVEGAIQSLLSETDIELAKTGLESELKLLEGMIVTRPNDRELLELAAQGFTGYTMMFVEDTDQNRARALYERGQKFGMRALSLSISEFMDERLKLDEFNLLIEELEDNDIPAAYWTAAAWASRINLEKSSPKAMMESPRAVNLMQWVLNTDPHFYYSAPLWYFGTYYASLPPMLGGSSAKSNEYFQRALKADGDKFLWGRLLYAKTYAVQVLDQGLFKEQLKQIVSGAENEPEDLRLLNRIASLKAQELLKQSEDLF